jgi:citrate synthase
MRKTTQDDGYPPSGAAGDYLTRSEALEILQIKLQTLYAYVSRGWIRSVPQGPTGRRLYSRQDVERMKSRADARSGHASAAAGAMRWGQPVIQSNITEITKLGPSYHGIAAIDLVRSKLTFERVVAERFWAVEGTVTLPWRASGAEVRAAVLRARGPINPRRDLVRFLAETALWFGGGHRKHPPSTAVQLSEASGLIATMVQCLVCLTRAPQATVPRGARSIAATLLSNLGVVPTPEKIAAIDAALILCADHELAQATFVARIAASAGADMGECIAAAILTQTGMTSARSYECAEDFLRGCRTPAHTRRLFDVEFAAHRNLPGFNHPLYPDGDPRAACLIQLARELTAPHHAVAPLYLALEIAAQRGCLPSLEVGLIVMAVALGLPPRSACGLFIVGRTAGWVAHIIEQRVSGVLLRPRADYLPDAMPGPATDQLDPAAACAV